MSVDLLLIILVLCAALCYWFIRNRGRSYALRHFIAELGPEGVNLDGKSVLYAGRDLFGLDRMNTQIVVYRNFNTYDKQLLAHQIGVIPYSEVAGFAFLIEEIGFIPSLHQTIACSNCTRASDRGDYEQDECSTVVKSIDVQIVTTQGYIVRITLVENELQASTLQYKVMEWERFMFEMLESNGKASFVPERACHCLAA